MSGDIFLVIPTSPRGKSCTCIPSHSYVLRNSRNRPGSQTCPPQPLRRLRLSRLSPRRLKQPEERSSHPHAFDGSKPGVAEGAPEHLPGSRGEFTPPFASRLETGVGTQEALARSAVPGRRRRIERETMSGSLGAGKSPGACGGSGKRETVYSDRFVPSRTASAGSGSRGFNLLDAGQPTASTSQPSSEREVRVARRPLVRPPSSSLDVSPSPPLMSIAADLRRLERSDGARAPSRFTSPVVA